MPANTERTMNTDLIDSHESRLQNVEGSLRDIAGQLGTHSERLDNLATMIDSGFSAVTQKIEDGFNSVGTKIEMLEMVVADHGVRITTLEATATEKKAKREKRTAAFMALLFTAIGAALAALVKEGLPLLLAALA